MSRPGTESAEERLTRIEVRQDVTDERLAAGNEKFQQLAQQKLGARFWAPLALAVAGMLGGWIYSLAQVPARAEVRQMISDHSPYRWDRESVLRVVERYDGDREAVADALESIRLELRGMNGKLDQALTRPPRRRR